MEFYELCKNKDDFFKLSGVFEILGYIYLFSWKKVITFYPNCLVFEVDKISN